MAGDWIKMRADLFTHPKVVRMASALKADTLRTVGGLMAAWCLFDAHSDDGWLDGYTPEVLDTHLRWEGFAQAMIDVGWLESDPAGGLVLPRFEVHNGQSAKRRAQDADRKRDLRKASASDADKKRTREEKRREEISLPPTVVVPVADGDAKRAGYEAPDCPHEVIVDLYHEHCPTLPRVEVLSDFRRSLLRSRWREVCADQRYDRNGGLDWWRDFFGHVSRSRFLTGRSPGKSGGSPFVADLEWLVRPQNFVKVVEGRYHREAA